MAKLTSVTENKQVKNSKRNIRNSLLELLQEKPLDKITVKSLCEKAGVNRGTFYRYYEDIFDLFDCIEAAFAEELDRSVLNINAKNPEEFYVDLFNLAEANKDLLKILIAQSGPNNFLNRTISKYYQSIIPKWRPYVKCSDEEMKLLYQIVSNSLVSILTLWIKGEVDLTPEQISEFVVHRLLYGFRNDINMSAMY